MNTRLADAQEALLEYQTDPNADPTGLIEAFEALVGYAEMLETGLQNILLMESPPANNPRPWVQELVGTIQAILDGDVVDEDIIGSGYISDQAAAMAKNNYTLENPDAPIVDERSNKPKPQVGTPLTLNR
jgi:hypothetical protein